MYPFIVVSVQEDEIGTLASIGYCSLDLLTDIPLTGAARVNPGHGTKNCKRMS